jgi:hypothetical protein
MCVLITSTTFAGTFLIIRIIERDTCMIKMYIRPHVK